MNTGNFTFLCRTKIGFGMNGLEHLPFDLSSLGSQKPLVLLDKDAHFGGCIKTLTRAFKESGMTLGVCPPIDGAQIDGAQIDSTQNTGKEVELLKEVYQIYKDKGFDSIIALGTGRVAQMAMALNMAVTLGPESLKTDEKLTDTHPLSPFAYIPTGMGTGMETSGSVLFNNKTFTSAFLTPDLAIIDPKILTQDSSDTIINAALTCLSVCCEAYVLSGNPPARAYCATGLGLTMENFLPLIKDLLSPGEDARSPKKTTTSQLASLTHASLITGIIAANYKGLLSIPLGKHLAEHSTASPGQAMAIILPALLNLMAPKGSDLGNLALPLSGLDEFSSIPLAQKPGFALGKIQFLLNELYRISLGSLPRTLEDTGLDKEGISGLTQTLFSPPKPPGTPTPGTPTPETNTLAINQEQALSILTQSLGGQTLEDHHRNQPNITQGT
jgi:alcohol dehydrogenase